MTITPYSLPVFDSGSNQFATKASHDREINRVLETVMALLATNNGQAGVDAVAALAAAAIAARDEAVLYDGPKVDRFSDLALLTSSQVPVGGLVRVIETGAVYIRVNFAGDLNYTGGGGVRLNVLTPAVMAFGAAGDGVTDDKPQIDLALARFPAPRQINLDGRTYAYSAPLGFDALDRLFNGTIIATNGTFNLRAPGMRDLAVLGQTATPAIVAHSRINQVSASLASSAIFGGTEAFPNRVGKEVHVETFAGDGSTSTFSVTAPFTIVNQSPAQTIKAWGVRADGVVLKYNVSNVSGWGTNAVSMTLDFNNSPPSNGAAVIIEVRGLGDSNNFAGSTLAFHQGYNILTDALASWCGAHHSTILHSSGHNFISSGSYHQMGGSASYAVVLGGQGNRVGTRTNTVGTVVGGSAHVVDGNDSVVFGRGHDVRSMQSLYSGFQHLDSGSNAGSAMFGKRGLAVNASAMILAATKGGEPHGQRQNVMIVVGRLTTNASATALTDINHQSLLVLPPNTSAMLTITGAARLSSGGKEAYFSDVVPFSRDSNGTARVNNSTSDFTVTRTLDVGSSNYTLTARPIDGGLRFMGTGAAGEAVEWCVTVTGPMVRGS